MKVVMMGRYTLNEVYGGVAMHIDRLSRHISCVDDIELHIITFGNENKQFKKEDLYIHMLRCSFRSLLSTPIRIWLLKREILKIDPDIVHAQGTYNPFCTTAMLFRNKYPVILTVLGIVAKEIKYETAITRFIGELIAKPNERYVISKIPNIIVGTTSIKNLISNITNSKIYVLPDAGIDFEKIQETQPHLNEKPDIFLAFRLVRVKGIDILIKAIPTVIKLIPNLSVYIAGSGPQESELRDLIKKLNLEEHVKLLGFISENEKYQYYKSCKIVVVPSIWDCQPFALFDAAASGKPVVASDASNPEVVDDGKTGFLFESENVEDLANKIIMLLNDEKLREKMGRAAKEKAKEYDWSNIAKRTIEIYKEIISNAKPKFIQHKA